MTSSTPTSQPATAASNLDETLRADVRLLGELLGRVIERDRGPEFLATIETIRAQAKSAREPGGSWQALGETLESLDGQALVDVARAFNQFLNLANIAEQTRDAEESYSIQLPDHPDVLKTLASMNIELVLTAHPTEVLRRTMIQKYDSIGATLARRSRPMPQKLQRLIAEAWHSDEIRRDRPSPQEEARWGFAVVENSLWHALPQVMRTLDAALSDAGIDALPLTTIPIRFASWMGGDRDGNPNVTADVTREVLMLARWMAADLFIRDLDELQGSLSMTHASAELRAAAGTDHEPYRALMKQLKERMTRTRDWAEMLDPTPPADPNAIFLTTQALLEPLLLAHRSLTDGGMDFIANGPLTDTIRRACAFGITLTTLDIRQSADRHTSALDELTAYLDSAGDGSSFEQWSELQRCEFLIAELSSRRPLVPSQWPHSEATAEVLNTCRTIASVGGAGINEYIISMASTPSDVLAVILLLREAGLESNLPIVPLFETLDDLDNAPSTLDALLSNGWYRDYTRGHQQVMIGYSDSAKDAGQFAAAWAQYLAQEKLVAVADSHDVLLTLFHGRGGAVGRGGGPAQSAIRSQPPGSVDGRLRVTEQGEMIRWKFGAPDLAAANMARYVTATLEATLTPPPAPSAEDRAAMTAMADKAVRSYRASVRDDPSFVDLFRALTPEQELGILALGSRPARRALPGVSGDVASLRAIPWVFAWTQVRLMLPAWLGTDAALADSDSRRAAKNMLDWPFFKMQIDMLEMVLAKADPGLASYYAQRLVERDGRVAVSAFGERLSRLTQTVLALRGTDRLLANEPNLADALSVRNTYLDPLHLLQAELLARYRHEPDNDFAAQALQVTMAGIASGLRNTG